MNIIGCGLWLNQSLKWQKHAQTDKQTNTHLRTYRHAYIYISIDGPKPWDNVCKGGL